MTVIGWGGIDPPGRYEDTRYDMLPEHMQAGARRWVEEGVLTGDFLTHLLLNDLTGAFHHADAENAQAMQTWVRWLWNEAPSACWGSQQKIDQWRRRGGGKGVRDVEVNLDGGFELERHQAVERAVEVGIATGRFGKTDWIQAEDAWLTPKGWQVWFKVREP